MNGSREQPSSLTATTQDLGQGDFSACCIPLCLGGLVRTGKGIYSHQTSAGKGVSPIPGVGHSLLKGLE